MKNYSRKFRRNRKGGFWPFDNNTQPAAPSNNGMINNVENQATNAFTTVKDGATTAFTHASKPIIHVHKRKVIIRLKVFNNDLRIQFKYKTWIG
jgi:hypothetical protein